MSSSSCCSLPQGASPPSKDASADLLALWRDAVDKYECITGGKLLVREAAAIDSAQRLYDFIGAQDEQFKAFRKQGQHSLLAYVQPLVAVVGTLSTVVGEGAGIVFTPAKAIFCAISEMVKATMAVHDDYEAACTAFAAIDEHLRIVQSAVPDDTTNVLREASVHLLSQILVVMGVVQKLIKDGRIRLWLKKLMQSKEVSSALSELGRLATSHHRALTAVTLSTARKTLAMVADSAKWAREDRDMTRLCLANLAQIAQETYAMLQRIDLAQNSSRGILESIQSSLLQCLSRSMDQQRYADLDKIFRWLQYPDSSLRVQDLCQNRAPSTGCWFLDGDEFSGFKSGFDRAIWLQGKAGCGKSTMIACAVQDLRAFCAWPDSRTILLAHYFDVTDSSQPGNIRSLVSSLLCQLAYHGEDSLSALLRLHKENMNGHSKPSLDAMKRLMDVVFDGMTAGVFLIVDALDEAEDPEEIIRFMHDLRARQNTSLLISCRGEVLFRQRLDELCDTHVLMTEDRVNRDIGMVLRYALSASGTLSRVRDVDLVSEVLQSGAEGNFRWTIIQIRELARIAGIPSKVRQRLRALPKTLSELYQRCLDAVGPEDRADVRRLLLWLLYTIKPLSRSDFAQLLSFDYSDDMPIFDHDLSPTEDDSVLALIGSTFISVQDGIVRLAHASVRDYLLGLAPGSDFYIDRALAYPLMGRTSLAFVRSNQVPLSDLWQRGERHHLTFAWVLYTAKAGDDEYSALVRDIVNVFSLVRGQEVLNLALRVLTTIDHIPLMHLLIDQLGANVDGSDESGNTALHYAVNAGTSAAIDCLLDRGACVDARTKIGLMPLHYAAWLGRAKIVEKLLVYGAYPNAHDAQLQSAIHFASNKADERTVQALLCMGADVNARDDAGRTPLHLAVRVGSLGLIMMLLGLGARIDARTSAGQTPLHFVMTEAADSDAFGTHHSAPTCSQRQLDIARTLIASGADPKARDVHGEEPRLGESDFGDWVKQAKTHPNRVQIVRNLCYACVDFRGI